MNKECSKVDFRDFLVREKDDKLDFRIFAKDISEFIKQLKTPFCMSIYGGWGTGKTTLMKFTKNIFILGTSDYILRGRGDKNE